MSGVLRKIRNDERGLTSVIVAVSLFALMGAAMISVDAGNLWSTRRRIITGTDASALHAAQFFNSGAGNPCNPDDVATSETGATNVLTQNHGGALHNPTDTPGGYAVTLQDPSLCGTAAYIPGKVRYDGRLPSKGFFSHFFGIGDQSALSSSTAAWGYITAIGRGLRPIAICDQTENYQAWSAYWFAGKTPEALATYNSYFGRDVALESSTDAATLAQIRYPANSSGWARGTSPHNPNKNKAYVTPDGTLAHTTIHRITMPEEQCGPSPGNRVWVDFEDAESGTVGSSALRDWILNGYPGTVSLSPHDCNPTNDAGPTEDCGAASGARANLERDLGTITCHRNTPAYSCPYIFPILVVNDITEAGGANAHYVQVAFLFVVMRGFGDIEHHDASVQFDLEFVDVQTAGEIGAAPPTTTHPHQTGVQLCNADHQQEDRCPF